MVEWLFISNVNFDFYLSIFGDSRTKAEVVMAQCICIYEFLEQFSVYPFALFILKFLRIFFKTFSPVNKAVDSGRCE